MSMTEFDLQTLQARLAKNRDPKAFAAQQQAKAEAWAAGQESEMQKAFCQYLQLHNIPYLTPTFGKRLTLRAGWPDVSAFKDGRVAFVELKTKGNSLTPPQEVCHRQLRESGCEVCVAYDLQTAIDFVKEHLRL